MNNGVQMEQVLRSITSLLTRPARVHHIEQTHSKSELTDCHGPGAPAMRGWSDQKKDQTHGLCHVALNSLDQL